MKHGEQGADADAMRQPASATAEAVARALGVDPRLGLSIAEVEERARQFGPNALRQVRPVSAWIVFGRQFASWIVALLGVAAVVAFLAREWLDGGAILAVLLLNSLIGFVTELRAARSMEALRQLGSVRAHVRRAGEVAELDAEELVPGDIVLLDAGDVVTADLRLLEASKLEVDESALAGESLPVTKSAAPVARDTLLADRTSQLFKGTALTRGNAEAIVTSTGMETELGRIAALVQSAAPETTPLEKQLALLGRRLVWATVVIAAITILDQNTAPSCSRDPAQNRARCRNRKRTGACRDE
jgi:Ca2+-transporting ATPase